MSVEIKRDQYGVPHIYANNITDLYFGYGYAAAQDRLFQLEMRRRQARGELSAVLGAGKVTKGQAGWKIDESYLDLDKKTLAEYEAPAAKSLMQQYKELPSQEQLILQAYLNGLNQRIGEVKENPHLLPEEFTHYWGPELAKTELKQWSLEDLLASTTNALTSFATFSHSIENDRIRDLLLKELKNEKLVDDIFDTVFWTDDPYATTVKQDGKHMDEPKPRSQKVSPQLFAGSTNAPSGASAVALANANVSPPGGTESMAILVGSKIASGQSIQLNGPQPGWFAPGYFYTVGLHMPGMDIVGHAPSALLAITTGQNDTIAWGSTSASLDSTIVYRETVKADTYLRAGQRQMPINFMKQEIEVRDFDPATGLRQTKSKVTVKLAKTEWGPFVGDPNAPVAYSKQILWKGKELWAVMAWRDAAFVRNWKDFQDRAQHMAMGYNWFYSDVAGNIGWLFNGHFPPPPEVMKALPGYRDTRLPLAGALAVAPVVGRPLYDLKKPESADGFRSYNPPSGYIVNWNNKPTLVYQNRDLYINRWSQGNRSNLLDTFVQAEIGATKANITAHEVIENVYKAATMRDVNFDAFAPLLRAVDPTSVTDKDTRDALLLLQKWNGLREPEKNGTGQYTGKFQGPEVPILTAWVTMLVDEYVGGPLWTKYKLGSLVSPNDGGLSGYMYSTPSIPAPNAMRGSLSMSPGNQVILRALQDRLELRPLDRPKFDVLQKNSAADAMIKVLYKAVAKLKKDQGPHMETWRQPMVVQNFFAENYEKIPTSIDRKVSLPWSANRGVMQRIAVGSKQGMVSQDANPPGECGEFTSKHYQDQVEIYGNYGFKPLQLHPQLPAGQIVALTSKL